jgi:diguanylate cyclase (GGDEF)-like protein
MSEIPIIDRNDSIEPQEFNYSKVSILVVDDEQSILEMLTDFLMDDKGYVVDKASDGLSALEKLKKQHFDIVLMDIRMPRMDGHTLIKEARQLGIDTDFIVMTGYGTIESAVKMMKMGAVDYLTKPFNLEHISFVVERTIERRRLLETAKQVEYYKRLSRMDGLTGLYNHRFFQQMLESEIERARRLNHTLGLFIIDIDNFKNYNDSLGHPEGDRALKNLTGIFRSTCRKYDIIARYGGEEFSIISPETGREDAIRLGERIRKRVEEFEFYGEDCQPGGTLTISLGLACYPDDADTRVELIERADKALYKAKETGRNKLCIASRKE